MIEDNMSLPIFACINENISYENKVSFRSDEIVP